MSTNKIALTSSMRSNLLSLKNTQKLFDSTQDKLSTGYKVNSAMDNPSSYFTAQSLNARADDLNTLLDSIGQAVSTLQVTDQGITSLQDLVSQAKSIANSARDTANVKANTTSKVYFDKDALKSESVENAVQGTKGKSETVTSGYDTMTIRFGDSTAMTGTTNVQEDTTLNSITAESATFGSVKIDGKEYKIDTANTNEANEMTSTAKYAKDSVFKVISDTADGTDKGIMTIEDVDGNRYELESLTTTALAAGSFVTNSAEATVTTTVSEDGKTSVALSGTLAAAATATAASGSADASASVTTIKIAKGSTVADMAKVMENMIGTTKVSVSVQDSKLNISTKDTTSVEVTDGFNSVFGMDKGQTIDLEADDTAESLRQKIDALDGVSAEFNEKGALVVKSEYGDDLVISGSLADKLGISGQVTNGNNEHAKYAQQFNDVLKQIDELVQDTSYKGINLLNGDDLTVVFNESSTSKMELKGVTFDSTGLGFTAVADDWKSVDSIDKSLQQISKATSLLRTQASQFGQQLSTIQVRQDFTENMVNQLQSGADKLVLADNNEEAANLLALQTRQSLGRKSLSLANQSAQSVLQLF